MLQPRFLQWWGGTRVMISLGLSMKLDLCCSMVRQTAIFIIDVANVPLWPDRELLGRPHQLTVQLGCGKPLDGRAEPVRAISIISRQRCADVLRSMCWGCIGGQSPNGPPNALNNPNIPSMGWGSNALNVGASTPSRLGAGAVGFLLVHVTKNGYHGRTPRRPAHNGRRQARRARQA